MMKDRTVETTATTFFSLLIWMSFNIDPVKLGWNLDGIVRVCLNLKHRP